MPLTGLARKHRARRSATPAAARPRIETSASRKAGAGYANAQFAPARGRWIRTTICEICGFISARARGRSARLTIADCL
jgi:hypothetical protein